MCDLKYFVVHHSHHALYICTALLPSHAIFTSYHLLPKNTTRHNPIGPSAIENRSNNNNSSEEDVSATMMRRARYLHNNNMHVIVDARTNIKMLSLEEEDTTTTNRGDINNTSSIVDGDGISNDNEREMHTNNSNNTTNTRSRWWYYGLLGLWSWIERVEKHIHINYVKQSGNSNNNNSYSNNSNNNNSPDFGGSDEYFRSARGLIDAGIMKLLQMESSSVVDGGSTGVSGGIGHGRNHAIVDKVKVCPSLNCKMYESPVRR